MTAVKTDADAAEWPPTFSGRAARNHGSSENREPVLTHRTRPGSEPSGGSEDHLPTLRIPTDLCLGPARHAPLAEVTFLNVFLQLSR